MSKETLKNKIDSDINTNGLQQITGEKLNNVLNDIVDEMAVVDENGKIPDSQINFGVVEEGNTQVVSGGEVYDYAKDVEIIKTGGVRDWVLGAYSAGEVVRHNGLMWVATASLTSAEPGINPVWAVYNPYQKEYTLTSSHSSTLTIDLINNQLVFTGSATNRVVTSKGIVFIPAQTVAITTSSFLSIVFNSATKVVRVINTNDFLLGSDDYIIGAVLNATLNTREVFGLKSYTFIDSTGTYIYPVKPSGGSGGTDAYNHVFSKYAAGRTNEEKEWLNKAIINVEFYNIPETDNIALYGIGKNYGGSNLTYLGFIHQRQGYSSLFVYAREFGLSFTETYDAEKHSGIKTYNLTYQGGDISTDFTIIGKITIDWNAIPNGQRVVEANSNVLVNNSILLRNLYVDNPIYNSGSGKILFAQSKGFNDYFSSPTMPSYASAEGINSMVPKSPYQDYAQWLLAWDDLMTNAPSGYSITKELLTDQVQMSESVNNGQIWAYKFKPSLISPGDPTANNAQTFPKIFINCSIHGYEKTPSFVTYEFLKYMLENWQDNEFLEYLRFNVEFNVIPVANPYGWNVNGGMGSRTNFNGVDLNRNFPAFWQSTQPNAGVSPISEIESSAIYSFMQREITPQTILGIDFHNFHGAAESDPKKYSLLWVVNMGTNLGQSCSNVLIKELSVKFKEKSSLIPQSEDYYVGTTNSWRGNGFTGMAMRSLGAQYGCTFEVAQNFRFDSNFKGHDSNAITFGVESFGNFLRVFLENFIEEYNRIVK